MGSRFPGKGQGAVAAGLGSTGHRPGCSAGTCVLRRQGVGRKAAWGRGSPLQGGYGLVGESLEVNHPKLLIHYVLKGQCAQDHPEGTSRGRSLHVP